MKNYHNEGGHLYDPAISNNQVIDFEAYRKTHIDKRLNKCVREDENIDRFEVIFFYPSNMDDDFDPPSAA